MLIYFADLPTRHQIAHYHIFYNLISTWCLDYKRIIYYKCYCNIQMQCYNTMASLLQLIYFTLIIQFRLVLCV